MILKALALGFSSGIFCLGHCAPILGTLMLSRKDPGFKASVISVGLFTLGRFLAYCLFGLSLGLIGYHTKKALFFQTRIVPALFITLGVIMILYGLARNLPNLKLCPIKEDYLQKPRHLLIIGFLTGVNLCPPFLLATSYVLSVGEIEKSLIFFIFFFFATSVFILPFLFSGFLARFENVKSAARITSIITGIWFICIAIRRLMLL
ncbi:MAG: sulfite exporter TauE/SafE family protein [Candidatus Omnitrophica bacterium]|nr:sulfite exporter TauE/SafE family protein [Candidatus Omnitrophota bacterium]